LEEKTSLACDIQKADMESKIKRYDALAKKILSNKRVLASIMKECIEEYSAETVEDIATKYIEGKPSISSEPVDQDLRISSGNEDTSADEGKVLYDIKFTSLLPGKEAKIGMIINVEAQRDSNPGYPIMKRGIYYSSRMISAQKGTVFSKSEYGKICKVVTVWVCMETPEYMRYTMNTYSFQERNVIGSYRVPKTDYDLIKMVVINLGNRDDTKDGCEEDDGDIIDMLNLLLRHDEPLEKREKLLNDKYKLPMTESREEMNEMCNLGEGIFIKGMEQGRAEGKVEGRAEGKVEGRAEGNTEGEIRMLKKLVNVGKISIDEAAEMAGLTVDEFNKKAEEIMKTA